MLPFAKLQLMLGILMWALHAEAQTNLGALLDAGAKPLTPDQFREELVQRSIVGPTFTGSIVEVMYVSNGTIQGSGQLGTTTTTFRTAGASFQGEWRIDASGRICSSMRVGGTGGLPAVVLPPRCQYWFKLGDTYFLSDSDSDRSAKVLSRTVKQ